MSLIRAVHAREVLDSRGRPTVEVDIVCDGGQRGRAMVPSGASTGRAEARELRDQDPARYDGLGVLRAVANANQILAPAVVGCDPREQAALDQRLIELDGTPDKGRLGANAILGVSLAVAQAAAAVEGLPLYRHLEAMVARQAPAGSSPLLFKPLAPPVCLPMVNMISGGLHAGGNLDFQDFLVMPVGAGTFAQGLEWVVRIARRLGSLLSAAGYEGRLLADEGGYGPRLKSNREAVEFVVRAIEAADLEPGRQITLALDVASSHFYDGEFYRLAATGDSRLTSSQMIDQLERLVADFPITSIEDGLAEEDWSGWQELTRRLADRVRLVGDDLFATNQARLARGIAAGVANSVLIKVNQIGTLTETLATMRLAAGAGYTRVVSARSGETEDSFLADLAVGTRGELIKIGSIHRSERLAKYNQLLRIEEQVLGKDL